MAMKFVLSRKGFDSSSGGGASPIVDGVPISLPIPAMARSATRYADLGLGHWARYASRGKVGPHDLCHHDPLFAGQTCYFGQHGAAQSHLEKQGIAAGDIFLFFGLFKSPADARPHHRIFGFLKISKISPVSQLPLDLLGMLRGLCHPHVVGPMDGNDVIYSGQGAVASRAHGGLRLTGPGCAPSDWQVPDWLEGLGLSYHGKAQRWRGGGKLRSVSRGQEFVCDTRGHPGARAWVDEMVRQISD